MTGDSMEIGSKVFWNVMLTIAGMLILMFGSYYLGMMDTEKILVRGGQYVSGLSNVDQRDEASAITAGKGYCAVMKRATGYDSDDCVIFLQTHK